MARKRRLLDIDCLEAARRRIRHVYDIFDTVCVQFSGGKDSTAVLYLAKEVHEERGLGPVKAIFRDEELVSPATLRFIEQVRSYDWVDLEWYCLPQGAEVWTLGKRQYMLEWSAQRAREGRLVRQAPPWAIRPEHFGLDPDHPIPEGIDHYTTHGKEGRIAFLTGVRANESWNRYLSVTRKLEDNYINLPWGVSRKLQLWFAKVIYDWTTDDVLKFLSEQAGSAYNEYYDYAALGGANLRVGPPLHAVASRRISDVVNTEPEYFDRLIEVYPIVEAHWRLWGDFDATGLIRSYAEQGWPGVDAFIEDHMLTPGTKREAAEFASAFRRKHDADPDSYPIDHLLRTLLLRDFYETKPSPVRRRTAARQAKEDADDLDRWDDRQ